MCVININVITLQPAQRVITSCCNVVRGEPFSSGEHAHLCGDHNLFSVLARLLPLANDRFALASDIAIFPFGVDICGVDEITGAIEVGIEDLEGLRLICAPAKYISAEAEGMNHERGFRES